MFYITLDLVFYITLDLSDTKDLEYFTAIIIAINPPLLGSGVRTHGSITNTSWNSNKE